MNTIIVIDRQYASGGKEIAQLVAQRLNIPCYDREQLNKIALESGLTKEQLETQDEMPYSSVIFGMIADTFTVRPLNEEVFLAQQEAIRKVAGEEKNGVVIIGRCADIALRKHPNLLNIFIHAAEPFRMERIRAGKAGEEEQRLYGDRSDEELLELLRRKDKERWSYYDAHAQQRWGQAKNYDYTINSALLGIEESAEQIIGIIKSFERAGSNKSWIEKRKA